MRTCNRCFKVILHAFDHEFIGVTTDEIFHEILIVGRVAFWTVLCHLDERSRRFLFSFHELKPDWAYREEVIGLDGISGAFGLMVEEEF